MTIMNITKFVLCLQHNADVNVIVLLKYMLSNSLNVAFFVKFIRFTQSSYLDEHFERVFYLDCYSFVNTKFLSSVLQQVSSVKLCKYDHTNNSRHIIINNTEQLIFNIDYINIECKIDFYKHIVNRLNFICQHIKLFNFFNNSVIVLFIYNVSYLILNIDSIAHFRQCRCYIYLCQKYMYTIIAIISCYMSFSCDIKEIDSECAFYVSHNLCNLHFDNIECMFSWIEEYKSLVYVYNNNDYFRNCFKYYISSIVMYVNKFAKEYVNITTDTFFVVMNFIIQYMRSILSVKCKGNMIIINSVIKSINNVYCFRIVNNDIIMCLYLCCIYIFYDKNNVAGEMFLLSTMRTLNVQSTHENTNSVSNDNMNIYIDNQNIFYLSQNKTNILHVYKYFESYNDVFIFIDDLLESYRKNTFEKQYNYLCTNLSENVIQYSCVFTKYTQYILNSIIDGIVSEHNTQRSLYIQNDDSNNTIQHPENNNMFTILKIYQQSAVCKSYNKITFGYFLEMGMGKTLLILFDMTQYFCIVDYIIVCTRRYMFSIWQHEIDKFNLTYLNEKIVYISIDSFSRNAEKTLADFVKKYGSKNILFVFDESTMIKHITSIRGIVLHFLSYYMQLRKNYITIIRLVTGTPYSNKDAQIASQIRMLDFFNCPSLSFFERFFDSKGTKFIGCKLMVKKILDERAFFALKSEYPNIFSKVILYYKLKRSIVNKSVIKAYEQEYSKLSILNKYVSYGYMYKLSTKDISVLKHVGYMYPYYDLYRLKMLRNRYIAKLDNLIAGFKKARQFTKQDNEDILSLVMFIIQKYENLRILFVSKYIAVAECICTILSNKSIQNNIVTGKVTPITRKKILDEFNNKCFDIIVCTYASITYGFSIYGVDLIVFVDPCYSYEVYKQFMARTYRLNDIQNEMKAIFVFYGMQENIVDRMLSRDKISVDGDIQM